MNYTNATIGMSFALFIVWMQRQGRWAKFGSAISSKYDISGSRGTLKATGTNSSSGSNTSGNINFNKLAQF